jgi:hypothetical protein
VSRNFGLRASRHTRAENAQRRRVIVESPYKGHNLFERWLNRRYARRCLKHSLLMGEAPIASHLLHTQVLSESYERQLGIGAGLAWLPVATASVFYLDRGWSPGMEAALEAARAAGVVIEFRTLDPVRSK